MEMDDTPPIYLLDEGLLPSLENQLTILGTKPSTTTDMKNNAVFEGEYTIGDGCYLD